MSDRPEEREKGLKRRRDVGGDRARWCSGIGRGRGTSPGRGRENPSRRRTGEGRLLPTAGFGVAGLCSRHHRSRAYGDTRSPTLRRPCVPPTWGASLREGDLPFWQTRFVEPDALPFNDSPLTEVRKTLTIGHVPNQPEVSAVIVSKLTSKAQTTIPKPIRAALELQPADELSNEVLDGRVILTRVQRGTTPDDPFRTFDEWHSEADAKAYADL